MSYQNLLLEKKGRIAIVTISRPKKLNALNALTMEELDDVFAGLSDDQEVGGVILTGEGDKAFVAGADIAELAEHTPVEGKQFARRGQRVFDRIEGFGKPVIAAINGFALGGGCELAMACHLRLAAEGARMGTPEVKLGIMCGYGGTQRLPRLVGKGRGLELLLSGEMIGAEEAHRIGLVNHVFPQAELMAQAEALLDKMLANGPISLRHVIEAVGSGLELPLDEAQELEAALFGLLCGTDDMKEGTTAFLEKRPAEFKGK